MKIIVFAGGTGKRFWPASRKNAPKQFLPIVDDTPLLKLRYDMLLQGFAPEDIFISTGEQYASEVRQIIPELSEENLILEPTMRDTGPAVTLAVSYIEHNFPGEIVSIQWSDHLIEKPEVFIESLKRAEQEALDTGKAIFVTVPARFPSPHRGYINFGEVLEQHDGFELRDFKQFVEKPDVKTAEKYLESKEYGWNPGYWIVSAKFVIDKVSKIEPEMASVTKEMVESNFATEAVAKFAELERISADYVFAENVQSDEALALLVDMGWSDIGEWIALKEAMVEKESDNMLVGNQLDLDSKDTLVYNYEDKKLVATIGLEGLVIVNTPDVVAVFKKEDNAKLKEFLKKLEEQTGEKYL